MTALLMVATTLSIAVLGWYGYKAYRRIEAWGRNMNEIDRIFQDADQFEGACSSRPIGKRVSGGMSLVQTLKTPHHHA